MKRRVALALIAVALTGYAAAARSGGGFGPRRLIAPAGGALDYLTTQPAAAYSLRKLRAAYPGPAVNVRRSSDNATLDIGFTVFGALNMAALNGFCGSASCFVTTWYDQSGNARNVSQATAANQPRIVNAGVTDTLNGLPAVRFVSTSSSFMTTSGVTGSANWSVTATLNILGNNGGTSNDFVCDSTGARLAMGLSLNTSNNKFGVYAGTAVETPSAYTLGASMVATGLYGPSGALYVNGASQATGNTGTPSPTVLYLGARNGGASSYLNGSISEMIFVASTLSTADRQSLEHSQEAFYGIAGQ